MTTEELLIAAKRAAEEIREKQEALREIKEELREAVHEPHVPSPSPAGLAEIVELTAIINAEAVISRADFREFYRLATAGQTLPAGATEDLPEPEDPPEA